MYTQSYKSNTKQTNVVTYPNKDCIIQMRALESRNETKNTENTNIQHADNKIPNFTIESLLIFGIMFVLTDAESISPEMFQIVAGILLAL